MPGRPHPQLAHLAFVEGEFVADRLAGKKPHPVNYDLVPGATYSEPEVASIGLTEKAAKERGYKVKIGTFPFSANGKARILDLPEGMVKVVAEEKYDEVLGVHIIGPRATELISRRLLAPQAGDHQRGDAARDAAASDTLGGPDRSRFRACAGNRFTSRITIRCEAGRMTPPICSTWAREAP